MSLTGHLFLDVVAVAVAAAFLGAVLAWPRLGDRGPLPVAGRVATLLLVNALVLFGAGVYLNDEYQFFTGWSDLGTALGGQAASSTQAGAGGTARGAALTRVPDGFTVPRTPPPLPRGAALGARVLTFTVTGAASGLRGAVVVALPAGYAAPANRSRRYPVLETFNGYPGNPMQWVRSMDVRGQLDTAVQRRVLADAVVVSPQLEFPAGVDTECVNGATAGPQVETWLTRDVPEWVFSTLRVRPDRSDWAAVGLSAGGWCAAMAALLHPGLYGAAVVMGGYFAPWFSPGYVPFPAASDAARRYDLIGLVRRAPPPVALWLETSHADHTSYPSTAKLLAVARAPLSVEAVVLSDAGHRMSVWKGELPRALAWLGHSVPGFAAAGPAKA